MEVKLSFIKKIINSCILFLIPITALDAKETPRIITLSPHLTELIYSAGAGANLVGKVNYSDYPIEAKDIPNIGDVNRLNIEKVLQLKPTHAFAWSEGNKQGDLDLLKKMGISVIPVSIKNLKDISSFILKVSRLTNTEHIARRQVNLFSQKVMKLEYQYNAKISSKSKKKVFFEIWHKPIMTLNKDHIVTKIIQRCNGKNIFEHINNIAPTVSLESVRLAKPDVILLSGSLNNDMNILNEWMKYPDIPAVKNRRIYFINPDTIERPTVRILDGYEDICKKLNY